MRYSRYVEIFSDLKKQGIPKDEAADCLEFDSDQYPDPKEIQSALNEVYGA